MESTKKVFKLVNDFISKTKEEDLIKLINGEYKISLINTNEKNQKITLKSSNDIDNLFIEVNKTLSRKDARIIIEKSGFTKSKLLILGELFQIKIPKSYKKDKVIDMIVDVAVGEKEDQNLINSIKI